VVDHDCDPEAGLRARVSADETHPCPRRPSRGAVGPDHRVDDGASPIGAKGVTEPRVGNGPIAGLAGDALRAVRRRARFVRQIERGCVVVRRFVGRTRFRLPDRERLVLS
jgi:hypothetical protein